jgi:hypothetical protein
MRRALALLVLAPFAGCASIHRFPPSGYVCTPHPAVHVAIVTDDQGQQVPHLERVDTVQVCAPTP